MNADEDATVHVPAPTQLAMSVSANVLSPLCPDNILLMVCLGFGKKYTWLGSEKHQVQT